MRTDLLRTNIKMLTELSLCAIQLHFHCLFLLFLRLLYSKRFKCVFFFNHDLEQKKIRF